MPSTIAEFVPKSSDRNYVCVNFLFPKRATLHLTFHSEHGFNVERLREKIDEMCLLDAITGC